MRVSNRFEKLGLVFLLGGLATFVSGCGASAVTSPASSTSDPTVLADSSQGVSLSLQASSSAVTEGGSVQFTASGGVAPYTFLNPSGLGQIDSSSGVYTAPMQAAMVQVEVVD